MPNQSDTPDQTNVRQEDSSAVSSSFGAFHHAILVPFMRLDERSLKNVAIDPDDNDICLMAADLCVSCYHFVERYRLIDMAISQRLMKTSDWQMIGDIANTRKHFKRSKSSTQVRLEGRLAYEISPVNTMGFIRTEVNAVYKNGKEREVIELLMRTIQHFRQVLNIDGGTSIIVQPPRPKSYHEKAKMRLSYETLALNRTTGRFYRRNRDGTLRAAEAGISLPMEIELDLPDSINIGRFQLQFDREAAIGWFGASAET
jgi:hypothetical protein